jgi:esterase/lipase superfamily enzyme
MHHFKYDSYHLDVSKKEFVGILLAVLLFASMTGCARHNPKEINLMPAPDIYYTGAIDPFTDTHPLESMPYQGILYVTDRKPDTSDFLNHFYENKRGYVLRLGVGKIILGEGEMSWEEARQISLLKNRSRTYPIKISGVEEFGILDRSKFIGLTQDKPGADAHLPAKRFAEKINAKLASSQRKDIYIYVHGYKVVFENPLLVATELWHFLGYDGVFIAYAWPSTPRKLAYFADLETAALSAHNFRIMLEYLAEETDAERIHIVGYSAGTRVVIKGLMQMALNTEYMTKKNFQEKSRIGYVILVGSDFDRQLFSAYVADGLLNVAKNFSVYLSDTDKALSLSRWLFKQERLGQMWKDHKIPPLAAEFLRKNKNLIMIDVTDAEDAATGNGHAYFRQSPWVSSDILATLMYDLSPAKRGLHYTEEWPVWTFPEEYITNLADKLIKLNPDLGRKQRQ